MMDLQIPSLRPNQQRCIERFVAACEADDRVAAAFLGGSYAKGTADPFSDLDLTVITTDVGYEKFYAQRGDFVRQLGEVVFLENFDNPHIVFFILADDSEAELWFASEGRLEHIRCGPYRVLLDKTGGLAGRVFPDETPDQVEQTEEVRRLITWFWHDLSHFMTAWGRGQLWWAQGQLDELRRYCINLARLQANFAGEVRGYEKVDEVLPNGQLAPLAATYCPLERRAMLQAAHVLVSFYQKLALTLAQAHGLIYPVGLERVMMERLRMLGREE